MALGPNKTMIKQKQKETAKKSVTEPKKQVSGKSKHRAKTPEKVTNTKK